MSASDNRIHSFIVRVWVEDMLTEAGPGVWRGHIIHVPTGEKRYLRDLDQIPGIVEHCVTHADCDKIDAHGSRGN